MKFLFLLILLSLSLPGFSQEADKANPEIVSFPEELKKLGYDSIDMNSLSDERVVALVRKNLKQVNLEQVPPQTMKELILEKTKGSMLEKILRSRPGILNCMVDIVRSEKAMSSALGIFLRKNDFKLYAAIWVCLLILGHLFKKIVVSPDWKPWKIRIMNLAVALVVMALSLNVFYKIFEKELSPSVAIIRTHIGI